MTRPLLVVLIFFALVIMCIVCLFSGLFGTGVANTKLIVWIVLIALAAGGTFILSRR